MTPDDHTRTLLALDMATEWQHPEASPRRQRGGGLYLPPEPPETWTDEDMGGSDEEE